jgi:hypothetical protein
MCGKTGPTLAVDTAEDLNLSYLKGVINCHAQKSYLEAKNRNTRSFT